MCRRIIKDISWSGVRTTRVCQRPEYKDGLCSYHYKRAKEKAVPYEEREGYRPATQEDLDKGRNIKLKARGSYGGHRYIKGVIQRLSDNKPTKLKADPTLFVIKDK